MGQELLEEEQEDAHSKVGTKDLEVEVEAERGVRLGAKDFAVAELTAAAKPKAVTQEPDAVVLVLAEVV